MNDYTPFIEEKERKTDFKQYVYYILDHIGLVLLSAFICAGIAFGFILLSSINKSSNSSVFNEIISQNKEAAYPTSEKSEKTQNTSEMKIDRTCIVKASISIGYSNYAQANLKDLISRYQKDVVSALKSNKTLVNIVNEVNSNDYDRDFKN